MIFCEVRSAEIDLLLLYEHNSYQPGFIYSHADGLSACAKKNYMQVHTDSHIYRQAHGHTHSMWDVGRAGPLNCYSLVCVMHAEFILSVYHFDPSMILGPCMVIGSWSL
jgi:hypothetical protein